MSQWSPGCYPPHWSMLNEHEVLIEALASGNLERAAREMQCPLEGARQRLTVILGDRKIDATKPFCTQNAVPQELPPTMEGKLPGTASSLDRVMLNSSGAQHRETHELVATTVMNVALA